MVNVEMDLENPSPGAKKTKGDTSFSRGELPKLTRTELEVLRLYREGNTAQQIMILRRLKSVRTVQLHLQSIRRKGVRPENLRFSEPGSEGCEGNEGSLRLHGEQFTLRFIYRDDRYSRLLKRSNTVFVDGSTVRLHQDSLEVYSCKSFFGSDADKCDVRSSEYWYRFFTKLESDFFVVLVKDRVQNIKRVAAHYERVDSALGGVAVEEGRQIKVYHSDGRLRFVTDRSNFGRNDETLHPVVSKSDRKSIDHHISVMLDGAPDLVQVRDALVAIVELQKSLVESNVQTAAAVQSLALFMKSQVPSVVVDDCSELKKYTG